MLQYLLPIQLPDISTLCFRCYAIDATLPKLRYRNNATEYLIVNAVTRAFIGIPIYFEWNKNISFIASCYENIIRSGKIYSDAKEVRGQMRRWCKTDVSAKNCRWYFLKTSLLPKSLTESLFCLVTKHVKSSSKLKHTKNIFHKMYSHLTICIVGPMTIDLLPYSQLIYCTVPSVDLLWNNTLDWSPYSTIPLVDLL